MLSISNPNKQKQSVFDQKNLYGILTFQENKKKSVVDQKKSLFSIKSVLFYMAQKIRTSGNTDVNLKKSHF